VSDYTLIHIYTLMHVRMHVLTHTHARVRLHILTHTPGTKHVGAIHGRALTAWTAASVFGPGLLTQLRGRSYNQGVCVCVCVCVSSARDCSRSCASGLTTKVCVSESVCVCVCECVSV
jgi:hypothetical protein